MQKLNEQQNNLIEKLRVELRQEKFANSQLNKIIDEQKKRLKKQRFQTDEIIEESIYLQHEIQKGKNKQVASQVVYLDPITMRQSQLQSSVQPPISSTYQYGSTNFQPRDPAIEQLADRLAES